MSDDRGGVRFTPPPKPEDEAVDAERALLDKLDVVILTQPNDAAHFTPEMVAAMRDAATRAYQRRVEQLRAKDSE